MRFFVLHRRFRLPMSSSQFGRMSSQTGASPVNHSWQFSTTKGARTEHAMVSFGAWHSSGAGDGVPKEGDGVGNDVVAHGDWVGYALQFGAEVVQAALCHMQQDSSRQRS